MAEQDSDGLIGRRPRHLRPAAASDGTIAAAIEACRRELVGTSPTPGLDARVLAGAALGLDASALIAYGENLVDSARLKRLASMASRRKAGEPVAYIVGSKEFFGLRLLVDRRVLIPRPETEELVSRVIDDQRGKAPAVLDLGTGCGAIACAIANALPNANVLATDVSADALEVASENIASLMLGDQIDVALGDLFSAVPAGKRFDMIAANLPYVGTEDGDKVEDGVRNFEPHGALFAGPDGLAVYRKMLPAAPPYLREDGRIYMECGPTNALELAALAKKAFPNLHVDVVVDLGGRDRMVIVG